MVDILPRRHKYIIIIISIITYLYSTQEDTKPHIKKMLFSIAINFSKC